jgi:pimeloyl-ACP methyl ester carboxylesterase
MKDIGKTARLHWVGMRQRDGDPLVLIHGLGCTIADWSPDLANALAAAGLRVVLIDNRDVGRSERFDHLGRPWLIAAMIAHRLRLPSAFGPRPPYTLSDMAADTVATLAAIGIDRAHFVGVSMGGMIAQRIAIEHPHMVKSVVSIMSSSGATGLSSPEAQVTALLRKPRPRDQAQAAAQTFEFRSLIAGNPTGSDFDELTVRIKSALAYGTPIGFGAERQYAAIIADGTRAAALASIDCPALVIHGSADPFVRPDHGRDTAERIVGARYVEIGQMAHEICRSNATEVADLILNHIGTIIR